MYWKKIYYNTYIPITDVMILLHRQIPEINNNISEEFYNNNLLVQCPDCIIMNTIFIAFSQVIIVCLLWFVFLKQ